MKVNVTAPVDVSAVAVIVTRVHSPPTTAIILPLSSVVTAGNSGSGMEGIRLSTLEAEYTVDSLASVSFIIPEAADVD